MGAAATVMVASLGCALVLTPAVRACAVRRGWLDHALTSRKVHGRPVPRLGGVAIVASFFAALAVFWAVGARLDVGGSRLLDSLVAGGLAMAVLGVYDDLQGAGAAAKFAVQFIVAALAWSHGFRIEVVALPLLGQIDLGVLGLPLTLLWIVGVINALNLVDGVDGLAAGISTVVLVTMLSIAVVRRDPLLVLLTCALVGAVLGFLRYNAHPASIFMGDCGSMFIGFMLAIVSIEAARTPEGAVALITPIVALGYPIADTLLAMGRRAVRGVPMFAADREHIHHRLLARGFSARQTTVVLCAVSMCLCTVAATVLAEPSPPALLLLATIAVAVLAALRWLGFFDFRKLGDVGAARRRNLERRRQVAAIARHLQSASDTEAVRAWLAEVGQALQVDHVALTKSGGSCTLTPLPREDLHVVRYPLKTDPLEDDVLEVGWPAGARDSDRDTEIAIERLFPHVRAALRRVGGPAARENQSERVH